MQFPMLVPYFREADIGQELSLPQQYAVWRVRGLGLVVAFRGTASSEDVFIDSNISPVPLASDGKPFLERHADN